MLATQIEVSDGTLNIINVGIEFFNQTDISVSLDQSDNPLVLGVDYQWSAATTIQFLNTINTPSGLVPNGVEVIVRRDTKNDVMYNIYDGGAPFNRLTLDENFEQLLFLTQEFSEGLGLDGLRNNLNMNGYRVTNMGDPVDPGDGANKQYVDTRDGFNLRTPEPIPVLPAAVTRAGKVLGFDGAGNPVATLPGTGTATELALDLADGVTPGKGASLIGYNGSTVQVALDNVEQSVLDLDDDIDPLKGVSLVGGAARVVQSIAALKALPKLGSPNVFVLGYYAPGDGGGGSYQLDAADITTADNLGTIIVAADGGRWRRTDGAITFGTFGAKGDNIQDDTPFMNAATLAVAKLGGGTIFGTAGRTYKVAGPVKVSSHIVLDFCETLVKGTGSLSTFITATLESGALVDNRLAADDIKLVENAHIRNMRVEDAYCVFDFKNWIIGCTVQNIKTVNCRQVIHANRCFYARWVNITAVGSSLPDVPTYHFLAQNNAIYLNRVSATTVWGFAFTGGSSAVHLDACTYEGGQLGFYVEGENHGFTCTGLYAEAVQGVLFNFADSTYISYNISGSYLNYIDIVLRDPEGVGAICEGVWDRSNDLVNVGVTVGGFLYRGLIYKRGARSAATLDLPTSFGSESTMPSNLVPDTSGMCTAKKISVREGTSAGDVLSKAILTAGVIEHHYTGDSGRTFQNQVAYCTHQPFNGTVTAVLVDTRIVPRDTVFAKYYFVITDDVGTHTLFGDIYGGTAVPADATGKTVTTSVGPNGMRLSLGSFTHPTGIYTCTGTVRLCA